MPLKTHPLSHTVCPKCEGLIPEVIYAEKGIRRGWWCHRCKHFERAIWRESIIEKTPERRK